MQFCLYNFGMFDFDPQRETLLEWKSLETILHQNKMSNRYVLLVSYPRPMLIFLLENELNEHIGFPQHGNCKGNHFTDRFPKDTWIFKFCERIHAILGVLLKFSVCFFSRGGNTVVISLLCDFTAVLLLLFCNCSDMFARKFLFKVVWVILV
jgi:hypothetical protein